MDNHSFPETPRRATPAHLAAGDAVEAVVDRYARDSERLFMSFGDAEALAAALYHRIAVLRPAPEAVIGIATGGLYLAHSLASRLAVPCLVLRIQRKATRLKRRLGRCRPLVRLAARVLSTPAIGPPARAILDRMNGLEEIPPGSVALPVAGKHLILVDDCVESGQTLQRARSIAAACGASSVRSAVITWAARPPLGTPSLVAPDIWLNRLVPHFPWSANSPWYPEFERWLSQQAPWAGGQAQASAHAGNLYRRTPPRI